MWDRLKNPPSVVYHYTRRENVEKIINDGKIKKFKDVYTFFTRTKEDCEYLLVSVTCNEKYHHHNYAGVVLRNQNNLNDYVIIELEVDRFRNDLLKWFISNSATGINSELANTINEKTICYYGDLKIGGLKIIKDYKDCEVR